MTASPATPPLMAAAAVFTAMAIEAAISWRHERELRSRGAIEPAGDVYAWMIVAYPGLFLLILAEGWLRAPAPVTWQVAGGIVWLASKGLKAWAIIALGRLWSFRVLVLHGTPLVSVGPYRWCRHPNYAAVLGEYAGVALALTAPMAGVGSLVVTSLLLRRRIRVEEHALGLR